VQMRQLDGKFYMRASAKKICESAAFTDSAVLNPLQINGYFTYDQL